MNEATIGFIGGGNMAFSMLAGLTANGCGVQRLCVGEPDAARRNLLEDHFGVATHANNEAVVDAADVVVFAVKPQTLRAIAEPLAMRVQLRRPLIVSIAAGVCESAVRRWLGGGVAVVRAMPNTPAMVRSGASALYAGPEVTLAQRDLAESVLRAVGLTLWLEDEALVDAVTALSGSGPAYFFLVMEALEEAGVGLGLTLENARLLTLQTALGAARMALESEVEPAALRERVTSPGGTTEYALAVLEQGGLRAQLRQAVQAAQARAAELSTQLGRD